MEKQVNKLCNTCVHKHVCMYKQAYRDTIAHIKTPVPFEFSLICPFYLQEEEQQLFGEVATL